MRKPTGHLSARKPASTDKARASLDSPSHWHVRRTANEIGIEKSALKLFLQRSPDDVTIEEIAEAAGISRRTFFRYFQSRDDLLAATQTRSLLRTLKVLRERPASESIVDALLATARGKHGTEEENEIMRLSGKVMARWPEAWMRALGPLRRATDEVFTEMVSHRLRMSGRRETDADIIAAGLAAIVVRVYRVWVSEGCVGEFADRLQKGLQRFIKVVAPARKEPSK